MFLISAIFGIYLDGQAVIRSNQFFTAGENNFYGEFTLIFGTLAECEASLLETAKGEGARFGDKQSINFEGGKLNIAINERDWFSHYSCLEVKSLK
jgi:hypothetical protein